MIQDIVLSTWLYHLAKVWLTSDFFSEKFSEAVNLYSFFVSVRFFARYGVRVPGGRENWRSLPKNGGLLVAETKNFGCGKIDGYTLRG